jgi:poly(3-hydroxybutyrate) depolymerase
MRRVSLLLASLFLGCSSGPDSSTDGGGDDGAPGQDGASADSGADGAGPVDGLAPDSGPDTGIPKPPCTANKDKVGLTSRMIGNGTYLSYVPASYAPQTPMPVVLALHGAGDVAQNYLNVIWKTNADQKGFIVIVPEGTSPVGNGFTWNTSDRPFILSTLDDMDKCYTLEPKKRLINGFSAGGIIAYWIGLKDAARFSGISIASANEGSAEAVNGGSLVPAPWKIPVSHFHGDQDMNFPIASALTGITKLMNAGHPTFWHPFNGGHTTNAGYAATMYDDLKGFSAP